MGATRNSWGSSMSRLGVGDGADQSSPSSSSTPTMILSSSRPGEGAAFRCYNAISVAGSSNFCSSLRSIERRSILLRLTKDVVETFRICNPTFKYMESLPRRFLTNPSEGVFNEGQDNAKSDLILYVNLVLISRHAARRYIVKDILGQGTFGQVVKCWDTENHDYVAVKVIKNQPAYYQQALVEVSILRMLNQTFDPHDKHHLVRILDYFVHEQHLCIAFEMLGSNLFELIQANRFKGFPLSNVQSLSRQILNALAVLKDAGIIHCDLKPENILLDHRINQPQVKVIDFGSACREGHTIYSYIQSRYYRSPEVVLGYPYSTAIDMWSFGCIIAELFLGLPIFPGASEYDLLSRMITVLGEQPPDYLLRAAKNAGKFFKHVGSIYANIAAHSGVSNVYQLLSSEEFERREGKRPAVAKQYFPYTRLEDIINNYPFKSNLSEEDSSKELENGEEKSFRLALLDLLRGLFQFDPEKRWSPSQVMHHPFITGKPFTGPYVPFTETPQRPVFRAAMVAHNPGVGHWVAAGLSPQVGNPNRYIPYNNAFVSYGSSYGSLGSHGSYNDNIGLASSYGSYGEIPMNAYHSALPGGFNPYAQVGGSFLGSSPNIRRPPLPHGNGVASSPGGLGPMSLGSSPSQYTPPNSQIHSSTTFSGRYGSSPPVRSSYGSSLGKAAAVGHYNKRRNSGYCCTSMPHHECRSQPRTGCSDGGGTTYNDTYFRGHVGYVHSSLSNSSHNSWRPPPTVSGLLQAATSSAGVSAPYAHDVPSSCPQETVEKAECSSSIPNPADWDPNYSDEYLLQEDHSDLGVLPSEFNRTVHLGCTSGTDTQMHGQIYGRSPSQRLNQPCTAFSVGESDSSAYDRHSHSDQNFLSPHGQQSLSRTAPTYRNPYSGQQNGRPLQSSDNTAEFYPPNNSLLRDRIPKAGEKGGRSLLTYPSSLSKKAYGGIL